MDTSVTSAILVEKIKMLGTGQCFECEQIWHPGNNRKKNWQSQIDTSKPKSVEKKSYFDGLTGRTRERYLEKLKLIDGADPYEIDHRSRKYDLSLYPDLVIHLSNTPSPYTSEDFQAYKRLEAFNQFLSGWVNKIRVMETGDNRAVSARVSVNVFEFFKLGSWVCYDIDYIMNVD